MSLLRCFSGLTFVSSVSSSSSISPLSLKSSNLKTPKPYFGDWFCSPPIASKKSSTFVVKASENTPDGDDAQSESDLEDLVDQDRLLEAKLLNKLEKKLKMKVAKTIRLRRKKLVHKRRLRKKGRWPPSKMKKLSHV